MSSCSTNFEGKNIIQGIKFTQVGWEHYWIKGPQSNKDTKIQVLTKEY